ncbi:HAD family hydrolase [Glacieibacterium frigidum]|uniref:HAD-IB family hydrolase n=1 Tax=Glacieibacterium frigidum TaxID=2593303 RepID=A0A552UGB2_9SPHN|nr:HAD-IB family hydrolase [Glacieibacterium frigidum]TRW17268.1 HAD-IB family hydrolase [Glacieibacterium frigidum]
MTPLSIFDMDRTITRSGTWSPWLLFWAAREAPWRLALLPVAAVFGAAYLAKRVSRARLKELNQRLLMGDAVPRARVEAAARAFTARLLDRGVFPDALLRLEAERAAGRRVVLATASCEFYVRAIADALGVADVVATRSVWDGDVLRARLAGPNCYGQAKRDMVEAWLAAEGLTGAPIRFFSDHVSDVPMFELADEQVVTTPTPKLRAVAQARGWPIIDWV